MGGQQGLALKVRPDDVDGAFEDHQEVGGLVASTEQNVAHLDHTLLAELGELSQCARIERGRGGVGQLDRDVRVQRRPTWDRRLGHHRKIPTGCADQDRWINEPVTAKRRP